MKMIAYCWACNKEHDISNENHNNYGLKCDCGGFIISQSGKIKGKMITNKVEETIMSDIRRCCNCGEQFHMDSGAKCSACENEFCGACDIENTIWILTKDGHVKLCKHCIREYKKKGIEWLKSEVWADTSNFNEQKLLKTIKDYEEKYGKIEEK